MVFIILLMKLLNVILVIHLPLDIKPLLLIEMFCLACNILLWLTTCLLFKMWKTELNYTEKISNNQLERILRVLDILLSDKILLISLKKEMVIKLMLMIFSWQMVPAMELNLWYKHWKPLKKILTLFLFLSIHYILLYWP
jgi:hypothetical protein